MIHMIEGFEVIKKENIKKKIKKGKKTFVKKFTEVRKFMYGITFNGWQCLFIN